MSLQVFDFRHDVRNLFITPEIRGRFMRLGPGETGPGHTHDLGHEIFLVLEGLAEFSIDGETGTVGPGQLCLALAGQWHEVRCVGDKPMTMYLSVTPHVEPTHTRWDRQGGNKLPYPYGTTTRTTQEGVASDPPKVLLDRHVVASQALGKAAQINAATQTSEATRLQAALQRNDPAEARAAVDAMWASMFGMFEALREMELVWNRLAPAATRD